MNTTLTVRMDSELKNQFAEVLDTLGLDAPTVVRMLAKQTVRNKAVPLALSLAETERDTLAFLDNVRADWGEW
ncbi:MAG: type II toxin-antitoxin system RelB/DinJ family antitoxin [Coriobacteriia bacterium]|nr:type II toxin-antitoxin system RelB/DinJ family antitoxin [Coriobacteriia bacterium]